MPANSRNRNKPTNFSDYRVELKVEDNSACTAVRDAGMAFGTVECVQSNIISRYRKFLGDLQTPHRHI